MSNTTKPPDSNPRGEVFKRNYFYFAVLPGAAVLLGVLVYVLYRWSRHCHHKMDEEDRVERERISEERRQNRIRAAAIRQSEPLGQEVVTAVPLDENTSPVLGRVPSLPRNSTTSSRSSRSAGPHDPFQERFFTERVESRGRNPYGASYGHSEYQRADSEVPLLNHLMGDSDKEPKGPNARGIWRPTALSPAGDLLLSSTDSALGVASASRVRSSRTFGELTAGRERRTPVRHCPDNE